MPKELVILSRYPSFFPIPLLCNATVRLDIAF